MLKKLALANIQSLRKQALRHVDEDAFSIKCTVDRQRVLKLLNEVLAIEITGVLRYRRHYALTKDIQSKSIADEFLIHANEEQWHADQLAERIGQLGGEPELVTSVITPYCQEQQDENASLEVMIQQDLRAQQTSIDRYRDLIEFIGDHDFITRRMLEGILILKEEHVDELAELLESLPEERRKEAWDSDQTNFKKPESRPVKQLISNV
ncbi:MAG: ferritin-like domain-containing protein [Methylobacter sp.]|nr:ferritin-like domain-containing protein [Methylobacter sp.]